MARQWIFVLCAGTLVLGVGADDLSDFSNNLATDLGPLLVLFGDSMTKQYLSESTTFLDYFIFAMAPIGILTAIISTIRVCGHSSLRAFIGRSQEGDGTVEAELCTSTSRDVCELFNRGGITRVLGKPEILELIYLPHNRSLDLLQEYLNKSEKSEEPDLWWQREGSSLSTKAKNDPRWKSPLFAPNPNLSLNVGIVKPPDWVLYAIATTGLILQAGVLALAGTGVWILGWSVNGGSESSASRDYAPVMFITGTILMCSGMWSCAALIGQTTHEVRFRRVKPLDPAIAANPPRLLWLQPGPQKIGDQSFDPFAYFEDRASNPLQTWTSSRKDLDEKFETYTFFAVLAVLIGYLMQFIGLRSMKAWISLAQLGITLIMSVLRGCLRMQRLGRNDNMLLSTPDMVAGYELDWLSFEIAGAEKRAEGRGKGKGEKGGRKWREMGAEGEEKEEGKAPSWHVTGRFGEALYAETQASGRRSGSESREPPSGTKEIQARVNTHSAPQDGSEGGLEFTELLSIRRQLAHLTGNIAFGTVSGHQEWKDELVRVRAKAVELCNATCQAAESLWKGRRWKHQFKDNPQMDQQVKDITLQIQAVKSPGATQASSHEHLIDILLKPPNALRPGWKMDSAQMEAILGLWMWTLVSDERVVSQDDSHRKSSRAEKVQCMRIVSAGLDDDNWEREANKKDEMDLWLGSNAVVLLENTLTLTKPSCLSIATLWTSQGDNNWEPISGDLKCETNHMRRLCGWNSTQKLPRPVAADLASMEGQQENQPVKLRVQVTPAGGSLLDFCAQELFTSMMMSLMGALNVEKTTIVENAGLIQLENTALATFARAFTERGLGSHSEALLCLVPTFRTKYPLLSSEDMLPVLVQAAEAYRKASEWHRAQTMLRWGCAQYAPSRGEGNTAATPGNPDCPFTKALRATGELYRWSLAQHSSEEAKTFGKSGIRRMAESYRSTGPSNPEITEILDCYEAIAQKIATHPTGKAEVANSLAQAIQEKKRTDTLYYLCFVNMGDFGSKVLQPALPLAVRNGWSEVVDALLEMKAGLNSQDEDGRTALSYCAEFGRESHAKRLVELGAFLDQQNHEKQTPLLVASRFGHRKVVKHLLNTGQVNVEAKDKNWRTPLSWAAEGGHEAVVRLLLEKGADIESRDTDYYTPLSWAAKGGHEAVVRLLLEKGANTEARDTDGHTPLSWAAKGGHEAVVRLLRLKS